MNQNDTHPKIGGGKRGRKATAYKTARTTLLNEQDALARVTWLYHHRNLTQAQIAQELGLSRPTIGRLLRQAAATGLVTVSLRLDVLRRLQTSVQWLPGQKVRLLNRPNQFCTLLSKNRLVPDLGFPRLDFSFGPACRD